MFFVYCSVSFNTFLVKNTMKLKNTISYSYLHKFILSMIICFVGLSSVSIAKEKYPDTLKVYIGPYAGYNVNVHFANFRQVNSECHTCNPVDYGTSIGGGLAFGGLFEYILYKDGKRTPMSIGVRLGYSDVSGNFTAEEFIGNTLSHTATVTQAFSEHIFEANIQQINVAPYFAYYLTNALVGNIGLNVGYMMTSTFNQRERLDRPSWALFLLEQSRERNRYDDVEIPNPNSLQFGILLGIGYEFPMFKYSKIMPELQYNFNFNKVSEADWRTSSLRIGAAVKFALTKSETILPEIFYQRDTSIEYKRGITTPEIVLIDTRKEKRGNDTLITESYIKYLPKATSVTSDISYYAIVNGSKVVNPTVVIEEFETTEYFPFLPIVYFKDGTSDLENTKQKQLASPSQLASFDYNKLEDNDVFSLYYNMLNILAQRMQQFSGSRVTITGYSSGVNEDIKNRNIASLRAAAVKNYLVSLGIEDRRIAVNTGEMPKHNPASASYNDVVEESQRVQIFTNDLDLIMPIVIAENEKRATPVEVIFELNADAEEGIKKYDLTLTQQNNKLRDISDVANSNRLSTTKTWNVMAPPIPLLEATVNAVFNVTDNANQTHTSSVDVPLKQITIRSKKSIDSMDIKIERYALCLFDFDKATSTPVQRRVLNDIKQNSIKQDSKLFISGYADRTGETQHNIDLAGRRIDVVNDAINQGKRINAIIDAVGNTKLVYDNNSPEGRAFSRTVRIEIHTPTK